MNRIFAGRAFSGDHEIAEAIDALYRESAAPRDHARLVDLIKHQIRHAHYLGYQAGRADCKIEVAA